MICTVSGEVNQTLTKISLYLDWLLCLQICCSTSLNAEIPTWRPSPADASLASPLYCGSLGNHCPRDSAYRHAAAPCDENSPNKHQSKRNISSATKRLNCSFFQHRPWIRSRSELSQVRLYGLFLYILTRVNIYTHSAQYTQLPKLRNLCEVFS